MASCCSIARACSSAAILAALVANTACHPRKELPVFATIPAFKLTAQDGREFDSSKLKGSVWLADFFFTNCTGPCPRMSSRFRQLSQEFPSLKLVSFTVDPNRDNVETLASYAKRFQAQPEQWFFLTGPMAELHRMSREVFLLGDVTGSLDHSTRFVLVDRELRIRGFYQTADADSIGQLKADLKQLLEEKA